MKDHSKLPADLLQVLHVRYRYAHEGELHGDIFSAQILLTTRYETVSSVVKVWLDADNTDLLDFRVDTYALIPF